MPDKKKSKKKVHKAARLPKELQHPVNEWLLAEQGPQDGWKPSDYVRDKVLRITQDLVVDMIEPLRAHLEGMGTPHPDLSVSNVGLQMRGLHLVSPMSKNSPAPRPQKPESRKTKARVAELEEGREDDRARMDQQDEYIAALVKLNKLKKPKPKPAEEEDDDLDEDEDEDEDEDDSEDDEDEQDERG